MKPLILTSIIIIIIILLAVFGIRLHLFGDKDNSAAVIMSITETESKIIELKAQLSMLTGATPTYSYTRNLTLGSRGADVTALQKMLVAKGYLKTTNYGYFGSLTKTALAKWQTALKITPANGYFGPKSRNILNTPTPALCKIGAYDTTTGKPCPNNNQQIKEIQDQIDELNAQLAILQGIKENAVDYLARITKFISDLLTPSATNTTTTNPVVTDTPAVVTDTPAVVSTGGGGGTPTSTPSPPPPPSDTTAPVLSAGNPSGALSSGTTSTNLTLTTDETAICKYDTNASTAYASMGNTFSITNATSHSTTVSTSDGSSYTYYVRCSDTATNANTSDYTISFSVESSSLTGATPDIYGFGFEDGTSGSFINGSGQAFIPNTAWDLDTTVAARGSNSVAQIYPASGGNVGTAFYKGISARPSVYVRVMYRQSDPFNKNGSTNNYNQVKLIRLQGSGFTGQYGSVFISQSLNSQPGVLLLTFADLNGNVQYAPNINLPQPNINTFIGSFVTIEAFFDISVDGALVMKAWINGVQSHDYTIAAPN